ncbi:MAG TPA: hypothetical protein VM841_02325 [Actinomycetota bacterium]|nr:hypothetical protein [Actinomycetota bacterium]
MSDEREARCVHCGDSIECCEFCDRVDCPEASCFGCIRIRLGTMTSEPHEHGG